ncbi:uncharacterized protein [Rutidosis leptorrhynchoides]|uniref:uncharacterized protein n=1 Tax=Rutidosis leptorrhynchoides TaxID=125765 RepID=UPI003A9975C8
MFNDFIARNRLVDLPLGGRLFTWVSGDGVKMSKLDRFLVSDEFLSLWPDVKVVASFRSFSDHCPIILINDEVNFGPKPFKIFDEWFKVEGIDTIIANYWAEPNSGSRKDCVFRNKLKRLKLVLKEWSKSHFGGLDGEIDQPKKDCLALEIKVESGLLNDIERAYWLDLRKKWLDKEKTKSNMLKQKARVKWVTDGDENTKYFHKSLKRKYNKNNIRGVNVNGVWCEEPKIIKDSDYTHFKNIFSEQKPLVHLWMSCSIGWSRAAKQICLNKPFQQDKSGMRSRGAGVQRPRALTVSI